MCFPLFPLLPVSRSIIHSKPCLWIQETQTTLSTEHKLLGEQPWKLSHTEAITFSTSFRRITETRTVIRLSGPPPSLSLLHSALTTVWLHAKHSTTSEERTCARDGWKQKMQPISHRPSQRTAVPWVCVQPLLQARCRHLPLPQTVQPVTYRSVSKQGEEPRQHRATCCVVEHCWQYCAELMWIVHQNWPMAVLHTRGQAPTTPASVSLSSPSSKKPSICTVLWVMEITSSKQLNIEMWKSLGWSL